MKLGPVHYFKLSVTFVGSPSRRTFGSSCIRLPSLHPETTSSALFLPTTGFVCVDDGAAITLSILDEDTNYLCTASTRLLVIDLAGRVECSLLTGSLAGSGPTGPYHLRCKLHDHDFENVCQ